MDIFKFNLNRDDIANQVVAGILTLVVGGIFWLTGTLLKVGWSKFTFRLLPHSPKIIKKIVKGVSVVTSILLTPLARFVYLFFIGLLLAWLISSPFGFGLAVLVVLISWSFYAEVTRSKSRKDPIFLDTLENLRAWNTISGNPRIDRNIGNPNPSMFLPIVANDPNNSCVELKDLRFTNGIIEADIYLEPGSLVNIVFRADFSGGFNTARYYMARFDSRPNCYDSFLRNDGNGWNFIAQSNHTTIPELWQKIRVIVSGDSFQLYNLNGLLLSVNDGRYRRGSIGIFNEVANVYVDNFSVRT